MEVEPELFEIRDNKNSFIIIGILRTLRRGRSL